MGVHSVPRQIADVWRHQRSRSGPNGQPPEGSQLARAPAIRICANADPARNPTSRAPTPIARATQRSPRRRWVTRRSSGVPHRIPSAALTQPTHHSPLTTHHSPLTTHHSPLTISSHEIPPRHPSKPTSTPAPPRSPGAGASPAATARRSASPTTTATSPSTAPPSRPPPASRPPRSRTRSASPSTTWRSPARSRSDRLNEDDLAAGLFDDAAIEIWRVNWADTAQRVLMRSGSLGEVRRSGAAFTAEVRGLAHYLQQPKGRLFQSGCDADLGDARCGVDLDDPAFRAPAPSSSPRASAASPPSGLGTYRRRLVHPRPPHLHLRRQRRPLPGGARFTFAGTTATIELWQPLARAIAARRRLHRHRRLRQAVRHLPGQVRQRRQLPRLPPHPRQRLRHHHRPPRQPRQHRQIPPRQLTLRCHPGACRRDPPSRKHH